MKGKYYINIGNKRLKYHLEIKRMITIIKGDSGTGKTTLITMLREYLDSRDNDSGLHYDSTAKNIFVLEKSTDWFSVLDKNSNTIFFADECIDYCKTKPFVSKLQSSGNYLVYITRDTRLGYLRDAVGQINECVIKHENDCNIIVSA
jgi:predicted ATPase